MSAQIPWLLVFLTGNTTLVHKQLPDFLNYIQGNLSSVSGVGYDDVVVNSVSFEPVLIVNVSVGGNYRFDALQILEDEDSALFYLSLSPFYVTSVARSQDLLRPKPIVLSLASSFEKEVLIYLGAGAGVALILSLGTLLTIFILMNSKDSVNDEKPLLDESETKLRYQDPPKLIYSENVNDKQEKNNNPLSFKTFDDNLVAVETDLDLMPRYIRDEDGLSLLSDGTITDNLALDLSGQSDKKQNLSTFFNDSVDNAPVQDVDLRSQMSRSPFYWSVESQSSYPTESPSPVPTLTPSPLPPSFSLPPPSRQEKRKKKPPLPPKRKDSLTPQSKNRPKSSIATYRRSSDIPRTPTLAYRPGSLLSIPCPSVSRPSSSCSYKYISQEEIDKDVEIVMKNFEDEKL